MLHSAVGSIHFSCSQTKIPSLQACPTWTRTWYVWKQTSNMTTREPLPQTSDLCWNANSSCPGPGTPSEITRTVSQRNYNCSLELMLLSCPYHWWLRPSWLQQVFWAQPWCSAQGWTELQEPGSPCPQWHLGLELDKESRKSAQNSQVIPSALPCALLRDFRTIHMV